MLVADLRAGSLWGTLVRRKRVILVVGGLVAALSVGVPTSAPFTAGTLNLTIDLRVASPPESCSPEVSGATECRDERTGKGTASGLGNISESYFWVFGMGPPTCPSNGIGKPLATTGRLVVAGKGEIHFSLAEGARCVARESTGSEPQAFTLTGGTGVFEAASGNGTVTRSLRFGSGVERWRGTLVVPGLEFDVTPPTLSVTTAKTVRARKGAKSVRVTYKVTARDALDGVVPVTCEPRSGARLPVGRTAVTCRAVDSSANTGRATFGITVRPAR
jgi:hypothetical protein